jgi:DNA polymerase-3 subunit gamma/tau
MYLKDFKKADFKDVLIKKDTRDKESNEQKISSNIKTVDQIKNIFQQDKLTPKIKSQDVTNELIIGSFEDLIDLCNKKKEIKLKYELENNVNLVTFAAGRIGLFHFRKKKVQFQKNKKNK